MICILKQNQLGEITGWIIATDAADARRKAGAALERQLEEFLYRIDGAGDPMPGKRALPILTSDGSTFTVLVQ